MDPNLPQPQDQRDDNGVPVPIMPPGYQPMTPPAGAPQQDPALVPGWFAEAPTPGEEPPRDDRSPVPVGRILKILTFVILILGIVGGVGYGLFTIFGVSNQESDKLATAQEAFNDAVKEVVYTGDGSDIERTADPDVSYGCPTGYDKTPSGKSCLSVDKIVASISTYTCAAGFNKTGTDANPECSKIVGGTKQTKTASKITKCPNSYSPLGSKCQKTTKADPSKVYSCPSSAYTKSGQGADTTCTLGVPSTSAVIASCASTFLLKGSGASATCTNSRPGTQAKVYPSDACKSGYTRVETVCSVAPNLTVKTSVNCPSGWSVVNSKCSLVVAKIVTRTGAYYCVKGTLQPTHFCRTVLRTSTHRGDCPSGYKLTVVKSMTAGQSAGYNCVKETFTHAQRKLVSKCPSVSSSLNIASISSSTCRKSYKVNPTKTANVASCPIGSSPVGATKSLDGFDLTKIKSFCIYPAKYSFVTKCNSGKPVGVNCIQYGTVTLKCKSGLTKNGSGTGTVCTKNTVKIGKVAVKVACEQGTADTEGKCTTTVKATATIVYKCQDSGFKLSGTKCTRTIGGTKVTAASKTLHVCRDGYKLEGKGDAAKCLQKENVTVKLQKIYICKDGWKQMITGKTVKCLLVAAP